LLNIQVKAIYLLIAILFLYIGQIVDGMRLQVLTWHASKRIDPINCIKTAMLGRYYNLMTPWMSGGMPYQMYYLRTRGFKASQVASIPMSDFLVTRMGGIIFAMAILVVGRAFFATINTDIISIGVVIGSIVLGIVVFAMILFASINKTVPTLAVRGVVNLLYKMKIIKEHNRKHALKTSNRVLTEYRTTMRALVKKPLLIFGVFACYTVTQLSYSVMIYFICMSLGFGDIPFLYIFFMVEVLEFVASATPMPGGTGLVEPAFLALMGSTMIAMGGAELFTALIIWKTLSYILPIGNGLTIAIYDSVWGNRKNRKRLGKSKTVKALN
jgi:hypothetical protein